MNDEAVRPALRLDAGRLWWGGLATAVVAGLIAMAGILIARGVFDVAVLVSQRYGVRFQPAMPGFQAGSLERQRPFFTA